MKLLRQALDCYNPRSLWHRPVCQCMQALAWGLCGVVAAVGFVALVVIGLVWFFYFCEIALAPALLLPAINLGLDDSNETLRQILDEVTTHAVKAPFHTQWLGGLHWVLLMLSPFVVSTYYQFQGRWSAAGLVLAAPPLLLPLAPTCIAFVIPLVASTVIVGVIGPLVDLSSQLAVRQFAPAGLVATLRTVAPLLAQLDAPFYHLVGALGVLLGTAAGLCCFVLVVFAVPIWALASQCKQDVQETLHEIDV
jgi:hypothetical protein